MKPEKNTDKPLRLFFALPIAREILGALGRGVDRLRETRAPVRWVRPEGMHLTLKFLGGTGREKIGPLVEGAKRVCGGIEPFPMAVAGMGAYPDLRRPRVVWAGVEEPSGAILRLQAGVEGLCEGLGWPREKRAFSPHVTAGRVKGSINLERLAGAVREMEGELWGEQVVESLVLFHSELKPGGAVYEKLHVFPLGKP